MDTATRPACCRCDPTRCIAEEGEHCTDRACGWCLHGCPAAVEADCCQGVS